MTRKTAATVRPLGKGDLAAAEEMWARSYVVESAAERRLMMRRTRLEQLRGVFVGDEMTAVGRVYPLTATIGGRFVGFGGVASLATAPEARRRGHVARLLQAMLREMRGNGQVLSGLYPFDTAFYRRYGWAVADRTAQFGLPTGYLTTAARPPGRVIATGEGDVKRLLELHDAWCSAHNLSLRRDRWWFANRVLYRGDAKQPPRYAYRYEAPSGATEGYVVLRFANEPDGAQLVRVRELAATTPRARAALLKFVGDFDSQATRVELLLPADDPLPAGLERYDELKVHDLFATAMIRVVDVKRLLDGVDLAGAAAGDDDSAETVLEVDDPHASWNRGRFRVAVGAGRSRATRSRKPADAELTIQVVTQLVTGYLKPAQALAAGLVAGPRPERIAVLARFAGDRTPFHNDYY